MISVKVRTITLHYEIAIETVAFYIYRLMFITISDVHAILTEVKET